MPPVRSTSTSQTKRPRPPFNPPRPRNTTEPHAPDRARAQASKASKSVHGQVAKAVTNGGQSKSTASKAAASKPKIPAITLSSDEDSDASDDAISDDADGDDGNDTTTQSFQHPASRSGASPPRNKPTDDNKPPPIPQKLLTRLLYESFEDKDMKIGREALNVFGKYMETFVREALARAIYERQDADGAMGGDGFLQVEDLEKLAPQLLLDF